MWDGLGEKNVKVEEGKTWVGWDIGWWKRWTAVVSQVVNMRLNHLVVEKMLERLNFRNYKVIEMFSKVRFGIKR